jgi:hypothetical protein
MKTITIWQPWAQLICMGPSVKPHETRSWRVWYRGPILIHASARKPRQGDVAHVIFALAAAGLEPLPAALPMAAIVAVARLAQCAPTTNRAGQACAAHPLDLEFGDWSEGRFAWLLTDVVPLPEPIPVRGLPGIWNTSAEVDALVLAQTRTGRCDPTTARGNTP